MKLIKTESCSLKEITKDKIKIIHNTMETIQKNFIRNCSSFLCEFVAYYETGSHYVSQTGL